jgi:hypothetical protein
MLKSWALKVLLSLTAFGAGASLLACCCDYSPSVVKVPAGVERGTVAGNDFVAVTQKGKVIKVNLLDGRVTDLGAPGEKLTSFIDVAKDTALVASPGKAYVIDLKTGKTVRWASFRGEAVCGLGLIGKDRAFVHTGATVVFLDFVWGSSQNTIELGAAGKPTGRSAFSPVCQRLGQRLYASNVNCTEVVVIDLDKCKVSEKLALPLGRVGGIHVLGDKALVLGSYFSYGVFVDTLSEIDLKTKKSARRKLSGMTNLSSTPMSAPDGTLFLVEPQQAYRYEASGKLTPLLPAKEPGRLVGFWGGSALVVSGTQLRVVALPKASTPATARK